MQHQQRRHFLTGIAAAPLITLSGRSALASQVCSVSTTLSANPSVSVSSNCGVSPGCWKNHALADGGWATGSGYQPTTPIATVPQFGALSAAPWSIQPVGSLLDALNGNVHAFYHNSEVTGAGFLSQCVGALLNAIFFGSFVPSRYPLTPAGVQATIEKYLNVNPLHPGQPLTGSMPQANAATIAAAFDALITDGYPCGVIM